MKMNPEERAALIRTAIVLEEMAKNLRYVDTANLSEDAGNAIVSHVRQHSVDALESLSSDWGFDGLAVCLGIPVEN